MKEKPNTENINIINKVKMQCEEAIGQGKTDKALKILLNNFPNHRTKILQIQNRLSSLIDKNQKGILEVHTYEIERNKITNITLELINGLDQDKLIIKPSINKKVLLLIGGLIILILGGYFGNEYLNEKRISGIQKLNVRILYFDNQYVSDTDSKLGIKYSGELLDALAKKKINGEQIEGTELYQRELWNLSPTRGRPLRNDTLEAQFEEYVNDIVPCVIIYGYFYKNQKRSTIEVTVRGSYYEEEDYEGNLFFLERTEFENNIDGIKKSASDIAEKIYDILLKMEYR